MKTQGSAPKQSLNVTKGYKIKEIARNITELKGILFFVFYTKLSKKGDVLKVYEVVSKLIGQIDPIGETHTDDERYENLKELTELTEQLIIDICRVEENYKNNLQYSMKRASKHCAAFLDANGIKDV